jgi:hypothetical protein
MKFEKGLNWSGRKYEGKSLGKNGKRFPTRKPYLKMGEIHLKNTGFTPLPLRKLFCIVVII